MTSSDTTHEDSDLGQLLEISINAGPLAEAAAVFGALGFRGVPVADFVPGARAVVSDGRLCIGLHDTELEGPAPTFVRPRLREHIGRLEAAGVELEHAELGEDRFHRAGFRDPNGLPVLLAEARNFPPVVPDLGLVVACGRFMELSVGTQALDESASFWCALGMTTAAEGRDPHPWRRVEGCGLSLGLHETGRFRAALTFHAPDLPARFAYLRAKGFAPRPGSPLTSTADTSATLIGPGGVQLFLVDPGGDGADEHAGIDA